MPRGLHDYSVRVCLPAGLKVASPLSTDRLIPGLARISEGFKHCGDPVRGVGCIAKAYNPVVIFWRCCTTRVFYRNTVFTILQEKVCILHKILS